MPSPTRTNPTRWLVASLLPVALFAGACSDVDDSASSDTGAEDAAAASDEAATDEAAQEDAAEATDTPADEGESDSPEAEAAALREYGREPRDLDAIPLTELSAHDRRLLLQHATILAYADGEESAEETAVIKDLAGRLKIPEPERSELLAASRERAKRLLDLL